MSDFLLLLLLSLVGLFAAVTIGSWANYGGVIFLCVLVSVGCFAGIVFSFICCCEVAYKRAKL